jgi:hypothetical protein
MYARCREKLGDLLALQISIVEVYISIVRGGAHNIAVIDVALVKRDVYKLRKMLKFTKAVIHLPP